MEDCNKPNLSSLCFEPLRTNISVWATSEGTVDAARERREDRGLTVHKARRNKHPRKHTCTPVSSPKPDTNHLRETTHVPDA